jgi:hypothetical protein
MSVDVLERPDTVEKSKEDSDDSKHFAHYAEADLVTEAYVMGTPIVALCGVIFVPHRDPERLPLCQDCKSIMDSLFWSNEG